MHRPWAYNTYSTVLKYVTVIFRTYTIILVPSHVRTMYHVMSYTVYSLVRATCIVYSYIVTTIGATTLSGYRSLEDQDQCTWYISSVRTPETATPETASEERKRRLQRRREQARARRTSETAEHREERLRNRRVRDRARRTDQTAVETAEGREFRLQVTRDRRAAESSEARETRLQRTCISSNHHERQASESAEARETRLQRVSLTSLTDGLLSQQRQERPDYNV